MAALNLLTLFKGQSLYSSVNPGSSSRAVNFLSGEVPADHRVHPQKRSRNYQEPSPLCRSEMRGSGVKIYMDQARSNLYGSYCWTVGTKFHPGKNVGLSRDHTIFALINGLVDFEKFCPDKKKVSVYPCEVQPTNPYSYRARKREYFRLWQK